MATKKSARRTYRREGVQLQVFVWPEFAKKIHTKAKRLGRKMADVHRELLEAWANQ